MPRTLTASLQALHSGACIAHSTLELYLRSGASYFLTTADTDLTVPGYGQAFKAKTLLRVGELDVNLGDATNRVSVKVANRDDLFSRMIAAANKPLDGASVIIKSYKRSLTDASYYAHGHFFSGVLVNPQAVEANAEAGILRRFVTFEVIPPETAAGVCLATTTLSPANFGRFPGVTVTELPSGGGGIGGGYDDGTGGGGGFRDCFLAGTVIATARGGKPIEQIKADDEIYSVNPRTLAVEIDSAVETYRNTASEYLRLEFDNGVAISVTGAHKFLTGVDVFVKAEDLRAGAIVLVRRGLELVETTVTHSKLISEPVEIYNFRVRRNRTYFANDYPVSNRSVDPGLGFDYGNTY